MLNSQGEPLTEEHRDKGKGRDLSDDEDVEVCGVRPLYSSASANKALLETVKATKDDN